ncbi:hypothetical protein C1H46_011089 [Malus baccata]|uniref:Reverse transcriptase Ty1/copia-type domain-containing protein n=1 Tax=Malus baccata TaxID=106549 RepID=A0A540MWX4_MALBA|nr:hypothetical protein C1H46_011089 [Malus baccata]
MVTASQLQILQSPITALISTIPTSVNIKPDYTNYLNWQFQMQLLLEGHGIMQFVDGSNLCPPRFLVNSSESGIVSGNSSSQIENDAYIVWKLHDRALMQLITATLSPAAISCAIGSSSACDLWNRLKEHFSTISRTSLFQMKSNLQTIKKGSDSVSKYLQRIKEARDYLSAAGVYFVDEDIVILALNGLPLEYNTFRCVIRGRENVISLKDFRSQLLAEELIVESNVSSQFLSALVANTNTISEPKSSSYHTQSHPGHVPYSSSNGSSNGHNGGFRQFANNRQKGKGKFNPGYRYPAPRQQFFNQTHVHTSGVLGPSPTVPFVQSVFCQLCNAYGHTAPFCHSKTVDKSSCQICGKNNHTTWFCFYNDNGLSYIGPQQPSMAPYSYAHSAPQFPSQPAMQAMHTMVPSSSQASSSQSSPQLWLADSGATNHMTTDLSNLSLASPYPTNETVQTANGEACASSSASSDIHPSLPLAAASIPYIIPPQPLSTLDSSTLNPTDASSPPSITVSASSSSLLPVDLEFGPNHLQPVLPIASLNMHPMQTRSKNGIVKKKAFLSSLSASSYVDLSLCEPATYKSAIKVPVWYKAMQEEIEALHTQDTWSLVPLLFQKNLVGCKWIFKLKKNSDGSISRHKARLVAKGFSQEPGLDYGETFSPVIKPTTIRLILALAAHFNWSLRQLDVKNAFLHGLLHEEVYMAQPPGFEDPTHPEFVCKLHKSLYGLKQAPRAWNERFTNFLPSLGFASTYADSSLFVKHIGTEIVILLLYVDDIIVTGNASSVIQQVIDSLTVEFDIKDLGNLHYFLGIQIDRIGTSFFLSQTKYIHELLQKAEMVDCKPCDTPCLPNNRLLKDDGSPFNNPAAYRSIVGALPYLTFTRPDIAFSVHQVCQFMQAPMISHYTAVKRILRYLKGTMTFGISYSASDLQLKAFSDADWAGDPNDRRSTTGLVVFLGGNPISWSSRKQNIVSRSSTEAEYRAMSFTSAELDWIQQLLQFLHIQLPTAPVLFCDNLSAIALSFNHVQHQRTKHIEIDVHFVRERVAKHRLMVQFVSSREQFADILTKGLSSPLFWSHCTNLMLGSSKPEIEGGC